MNKFRAVFLTVFIAALLFRTTFPEVIEFKGDEALNILLASRILFGHSFAPGSSVSSVGILNPPLTNYILLPFTLVSRDPTVISLLIGFLNSLTIAFLFLIIKKYFNIKTAIFTSILIAFSPWAIIYSRKIWPQDLIFPLFIVIFYSVHKILIEKKNVFWIPLIASCLFLIQIHLITIFFVSILIIFLIKKSKPELKHILLGILVGLLPLVPYLLFEIKNGCPDCAAFINSRNRLSAEHSLLLFLRPLQMMGVGDFKFILGEDLMFLKNTYPLATLLIKMLLTPYVILPFGIFVFFKKYKNLRIWVYTAILLPLIYFIFKIEPLMHYFLTVLPLLFLFVGTFFCFLTNSRNKIIKFSSYFLFILIVFSYISFDFYFFNFLQTKKTVNGDFGSIYSIGKQEIEKNLSKYKRDPHYEEIFLTSFVPQFIFQGDLPMANIFFDREKTKKNLTSLENRLKQVPEDYRVQNELISYYSKTIPTIKVINFLRKKSEKIPGYSNVYNELYHGSYLNRGHKKEYYSEIYKISFAYPEHWTVVEGDNIITLKGDNLTFKISEKPIGKELLKLKKNSFFLFFTQENQTVKEIVESIREY